ncbi:hypothetical protein F511_22321 [Dorcoceras hygrometricum]|uniref:Uncharacterized protein n=1 Tax=Dorcoceras hygrometricum TaxID=472368 RepID=A0A2Z7CZG2_9LAMI|nr:hypothetical protein F511_22321 [Dorcoceras hygrometricum]
MRSRRSRSFLNTGTERREQREDQNSDYEITELTSFHAVAPPGTVDLLVDDAIEILELVVGMREEKLRTAYPDVDDEKKRLAELLKEVGKVRNRKKPITRKPSCFKPSNEHHQQRWCSSLTKIKMYRYQPDGRNVDTIPQGNKTKDQIIQARRGLVDFESTSMDFATNKVSFMAPPLAGVCKH